MITLTLLLVSHLAAPGTDLVPDHPWQDELAQRYRKSTEIASSYSRLVYQAGLTPHWIEGAGSFWYETRTRGKKAFVLVQPAEGKRGPAFDHVLLAAALSKATNRQLQPDVLPFDGLEFLNKGKAFRFAFLGKQWTCDLGTYSLQSAAIVDKPSRPEEPWSQNLWPPQTDEALAPDKSMGARIVGDNVVVRPKGGADTPLTTDGNGKGYYARVEWTPDGKRIIAAKVVPGDRKKVYLIQSSPAKWGPAVLRERVYDRPGDKVDTFTQSILDPQTKTVVPVKVDPTDYGDMPDLHWRRDGRHYLYEKMDRGYGRYRVIQVDSVTGKSKAFIDERSKTFVDSTSQYIRFCEGTDEILYRSERDGFGRLYHVAPDGKMTQITSGPGLVREVVRVDEKRRIITFTASGVNPGEDPYFLHYYSVGFDGSGLTALTPAIGNHSAELSPDGEFLVDTYSQVNVPPVHELRKANGELVMELERADTKDLMASGFVLPEPFVAKGRDGKTDIYGVYYLPTYFDPSKSYPILEDIYAGPQDSFVPKSFGRTGYDQGLAQLGFIVVQIDGMGTRNRGKAFHDVCYKNLADAGFLDRILWMKALHEKIPAADLSRVGVFGTSAGGQSSCGAVLFHPEFYKVAVSSCGCHDNRLDKIWWNEQWMGRIGPHYAQQSNITNAGRLKGHLMLIVGELDTNVPPETTYRLADALEKAGKEFELVVIPGSDHTSGGPYGDHKRRDFFVRHLIGVQPPPWNK